MATRKALTHSIENLRRFGSLVFPKKSTIPGKNNWLVFNLSDKYLVSHQSTNILTIHKNGVKVLTTSADGAVMYLENVILEDLPYLHTQKPEKHRATTLASFIRIFTKELNPYRVASLMDNSGVALFFEEAHITLIDKKNGLVGVKIRNVMPDHSFKKLSFNVNPSKVFITDVATTAKVLMMHEK